MYLSTDVQLHRAARMYVQFNFANQKKTKDSAG